MKEKGPAALGRALSVVVRCAEWLGGGLMSDVLAGDGRLENNYA
jgi:hypothetical protein